MTKILSWANQHRRRTGRWPAANSGRVVGCPGETWGGLNTALRFGFRGLPGGDSLSQLLHRRRSRPERRGRPANTSRQRLAARLRGGGLTFAEIGRRLGVSRQRIAQLLRPTAVVGARRRGKAS